jgi:hypothetical protein
LVIAGRVDEQACMQVDDTMVRVVSLVDKFGEEQAVGDTVACVESAVRESLGQFQPG